MGKQDYGSYFNPSYDPYLKTQQPESKPDDLSKGDKGGTSSKQAKKKKKHKKKKDSDSSSSDDSSSSSSEEEDSDVEKEAKKPKKEAGLSKAPQAKR
mmetsp:Transcript_9145/g.6898  ORF Transcript_9145/g.6898 Transcript_9145/m.6898 type:complete len:97 (-) Transcript_9145:1121-1411(-)|eukprot:CAMPEP_0202977648 /NCGR_PEP_ID=MMETSP1396-20130829/84374_1 /ASSEMBLY_ACC=CAM_ASM_000872 /TAXON_ID= /ORGANISM="Pseudokeronopsis sp., Strain Brazil" /LENGTH=96 /DNA_ID=CAMNT_0049716435 /DNA_START=553 /DNA_END=843 /DNA_ORIENTATION=+